MNGAVLAYGRGMRTVVLGAFLVAACSAGADAGDDDAGDANSPAITDQVDADLVREAAPDVTAAAPHLEAFFAVPKQDGTGDGALETKIIELIDGTPKGARIRMSMYGFTRIAVADALGNAYDRKVDVQIVLDEEENLRTKTAARLVPTAKPTDNDDVVDEDVDAATTPASDAATAVAKVSKYNDAVAELFKRLPDAKITMCTRGSGSCIGNGIDHNKIYMFSTTGSSHDVVVQSSANLTTHHLHNNLVISRGDADLYAGYVHYFDDLQKRKENLNYYRSEQGDHTIAYHYPRASGDTIVSILDNVRCSNKTHHTVYVTMAFFTQSRHAIADRLTQLQADGCDVRVNMRHAGTDVDQSIIDILRGKARAAKYKTDIKTYPDAQGTNIHSKYLIVDAAYENSKGERPVRQLVWTGSHNYTGGALRNNDESLLRVDDKGVFDAFVANWKAIRAQM